MRIRNFRDIKKDRLYQRIWGGVVLPGEKPGFAVVVAEEASMDQAPNLYTLAEAEEEIMEKLIVSCIEMTSEFQVSDWYGRTSDKESMYYLSDFNSQAIDRHRKTFDIMPAYRSKSGLIEYHINILLEKLKPNNTKLIFHKESRLDSFLQDLPVSKISTAKDTDYPAIAALGYVVSEFHNNPYAIGESFQSKTCITDYDFLNYKI